MLIPGWREYPLFPLGNPAWKPIPLRKARLVATTVARVIRAMNGPFHLGKYMTTSIHGLVQLERKKRGSRVSGFLKEPDA